MDILFHFSDGSLSNAGFPAVLLASFKALFQDVSWVIFTFIVLEFVGGFPLSGLLFLYVFYLSILDLVQGLCIHCPIPLCPPEIRPPKIEGVLDVIIIGVEIFLMP